MDQPGALDITCVHGEVAPGSISRGHLSRHRAWQRAAAHLPRRSQPGALSGAIGSVPGALFGPAVPGLLDAQGWSTYRSYAGLEPDWAFIDYAPLRALVAKGVAADYGAYVETGLARDDEEFAQLYRQARLSMGSESFAVRVSANNGPPAG
jgi:hypothetical protein